MQLPISYLDASALEEIPVELWRQIFVSVGCPASLQPDSFNHEDLRRAFESDEPSDGLLQALEAIHCLGTSEGREALLQAMEERSVETPDVPGDCGEREFAARMFLVQQGEPSIADAFLRAQVQVDAKRGGKAFHEYRGRDARALQSLPRTKERLTELMQAFCQASSLGGYVRVHAFETDRACIFQVIHSDRTKTPLAVVNDGAERAMIRYRPVHCDVVRYDAATGRLQVSARRAGMVQKYLRLVGDAFFGDPSFFGSEPACTLEPLQRLGRSALNAHEISGIGQVRLTEIRWERGDRRVHQIRSYDCFDDIEQLGLPVAIDGTLVEAKLKIQVVGSSTRPVTVTVRVPSKIDVRKDRREELILSYLDAIGVRCRATPSTIIDLWSLHPWRCPRTVWGAVFGDDVEALCHTNAMTSVTLDAVPHPELSGAGNSLEIVSVGDGGYYGVGREGEFPSRSLSATDVEGLALNVKSFTAHLGKHLDMLDATVHTNEFINLGPLVVGNYKIHPIYLLRLPDPGIGERIRKATFGAMTVMLVPRGRTINCELSEVEISCALPTRREIERAVVTARELQGCVPAIHFAREGVELVVDARFGKVWVHGIEIDGIKDDTHAFRFVEALAEVCPGSIGTAALGKKLSPASPDHSKVARNAKLATMKAIGAALAREGMELNDSPFPNAAKSYRCSLSAQLVGGPIEGSP